MLLQRKDNMKPKETVTCASFLSSFLGSPKQSPNDHDYDQDDDDFDYDGADGC